MDKLIIFGGSFDPIHNAHIEIAKIASNFLNAQVVFVPSKSPRWKDPNSCEIDRYEMVKIALESSETGFLVSDFEIKSSDEINYTYKTINYFKEKYPNTALFLLIGTDQVNKFADWKNPLEIAKNAQICFVNRPDNPVDLENVEKFNMLEIKTDFSSETSSTKIRNLASIDTPYRVLNYISSHRLYYFNNICNYISGKRLEHSISVANLCYFIARNNNLSVYKAYVAGLLHDIGKKYEDKNEEGASNIMNNEFSQYLCIGKFADHQFIGSYLAKAEFGILDEEIVNAIKFHTTGNKEMNDYAKIVYSADKIDPLRGYDSKYMIEECVKDFNKGFILVLNENRKFLLQSNKSVGNPLTESCFNYYLGE